VAEVVRARVEGAALQRLVARGHVMLAGLTPSDASHVLGSVAVWDTAAAEKALVLFARRRSGRGDRIAPDAATMARAVVARLTAQTVDCLLEAAFAEDTRDWGLPPAQLARHPLTVAGLDNHAGVLRMAVTLGVPVIGLGASAATYYGAVGDRLGARMVLPDHADVANAIGAVVGQVAMVASGTVTSGGPGMFVAHLPAGPQRFADRDTALTTLEAALTTDAQSRARAAGVEEIRLSVQREIDEVAVENQPMFIEARLRVTAQGRPRIAAG
jgi:N-methylhydantoinase A/oxoprolinase/acetone carboxylase beta subunit